MTKQEQIEEMDIMINNHITNGLLPTRWLAEALYDAGYRKVDEVRKETAREILQTLYDKCYEIDTEYDESIGNFVADNDILCLAKHCGVEVEQ